MISPLVAAIVAEWHWWYMLTFSWTIVGVVPAIILVAWTNQVFITESTLPIVAVVVGPIVSVG